MPKVSELAALYPNDCEALQSLRAECAHHTYFVNSGYINYYVNDNFKPFEHRLMAELIHGEIPAGYQVHHINHVRSDNRACNLEILSNREHQHLHRPPTGQTLTCPICKRPFYVVQKRDIERATQNYCGRKCVAIAQRKTQWPTPEELGSQIQAIGNWKALGRMYGVSDNAVRNWARTYGLI